MGLICHQIWLICHRLWLICHKLWLICRCHSMLLFCHSMWLKCRSMWLSLVVIDHCHLMWFTSYKIWSICHIFWTDWLHDFQMSVQNFLQLIQSSSILIKSLCAKLFEWFILQTLMKQYTMDVYTSHGGVGLSKNLFTSSVPLQDSHNVLEFSTVWKCPGILKCLGKYSKI